MRQLARRCLRAGRLGTLALLASHGAWAATPSAAGFPGQAASPELRHVQDWIVDSGDNHRLPYLIIDKVNARVFAFDGSGRFQGAEPVLLGMSRGDRIVAGSGDQKLGSIRPEDRATPAGRYMASLDHDLNGKSILLIDYDASIALHSVVTSIPEERRLQRLQSATADDNRISFGCINVSPRFFENVVSPAFARGGPVYILPERGKASEVFGSYEVDAGVVRRAVRQP